MRLLRILHSLQVHVSCAVVLAAILASDAAALAHDRRSKPALGSTTSIDTTTHSARPLHVIDWFSYGPGRGEIQTRGAAASILLDSPKDATSRAFSRVEEEIVVVGERQRRDFALTRPSEELTGPRALDAAQPVVPWIGTACSYKTLCYDMDQPPLRAVLAKLFGD